MDRRKFVKSSGAVMAVSMIPGLSLAVGKDKIVLGKMGANLPDNPQEGVPYRIYDCFLDLTGDYPVPIAPKYIEWFERSRLGMFVHWNHSSLVPTEISWAMYAEKKPGMPMKEYENLAKRFNPVSFNAAEWVRLAQEAGMAHILVVVKHHDGFAMWDTKVSDYKITNTPFKRDYCAEIAEACHKAGMRYGFYYSPADWWHTASRAADWDGYVGYMQEQLRELVTSYGDIDMLAMDFWSPACNHKSWTEFYKELRKLAPRTIFSRNTPWAIGDFEVVEHFVPYVRTPGSSELSNITSNNNFKSRMNRSALFETYLSVQQSGWSYNNGSAIPLNKIVNQLVDTAGCGGNLTLNITPDSNGKVPPAQVELLQNIGKWMRENGETIIGTSGTHLEPAMVISDQERQGSEVPVMLGEAGSRPKKSRCVIANTGVGKRLYIHVLDWMGKETISVPIPGDQLVDCRIKGGGALLTKRMEGEIRITVPEYLHQPMDTIIVLELASPVSDIRINKAPGFLI